MRYRVGDRLRQRRQLPPRAGRKRPCPKF